MELLKDDLLPGDCIIITAKNTWFRRLVAWFTQTPRESKTVAVHICGVSSNKTIIESLVKVVERELKDWMKGRTEFEIWRNKKWTYEQRQKISDELYDYMGRFYGFWKLFFHGFDFLLSKICFKEIFLFRRLLKSEKYPICSWVYAYSVYNAVGYQFNNIRPNWVDPDVMHDEMIRSKDWEIIFRYTKKKKHINTSV